MELDDLRRQWRQPEVAGPPALTARELEALLKNRTASVVEKMRLAAWLEVGLALVMAAGSGAVLLWSRNELARFYAGGALGLMGVLLVLYYRMLRTLGRMTEPASSVRGHLGTLVLGLRQLLRFYYRITLATTPVMLTLVLGFMLWKLAATGRQLTWQVGAVITGIGLVAGTVTQVGMVYVGRWYVQRVYGRHLDRLQAQVRELEETEL